jgi:hypothetical protein
LFIGVASILWAKRFISVACCYVGLFCFVDRLPFVYRFLCYFITVFFKLDVLVIFRWCCYDCLLCIMLGEGGLAGGNEYFTFVGDLFVGS